MRAALVVVSLVAVVAAACWVGTGDRAAAGAGFDTPRAPLPPGAARNASTVDIDAARAVYGAPVGRMVAKGPAMTVDEVGMPNAPLNRLTISGDFPPRALHFTVLVDGKPAGRGVPTAKADALRVALPELRSGAAVTYRYGEGRQVSVGTLTLEGK